MLVCSSGVVTVSSEIHCGILQPQCLSIFNSLTEKCLFVLKSLEKKKKRSGDIYPSIISLATSIKVGDFLSQKIPLSSEAFWQTPSVWCNRNSLQLASRLSTLTNCVNTQIWLSKSEKVTTTPSPKKVKRELRTRYPFFWNRRNLFFLNTPGSDYSEQRSWNPVVNEDLLGFKPWHPSPSPLLWLYKTLGQVY